MPFGSRIKIARVELEISQRHDEWARENSNPVYSPEAIQFAREQLGATGRVRKGTFSSSSLESCARRQIFTFLGWAELKPVPKVVGIFHNGTFMHIRWQMAGLTEGWLAHAEVPVLENDLGLSGTLDGVSDRNSVVEFKSINTRGFSAVNTFGVKEAHRFQVGTYMLTTGRSKALVLYEDKNTQEYREFVVELDSELANDVAQRADYLWDLVTDKKLPEPLDKCMAGEGFQYNGCPFRDRCLKTKTFAQAEEIAA